MIPEGDGVTQVTTVWSRDSFTTYTYPITQRPDMGLTAYGEIYEEVELYSDPPLVPVIHSSFDDQGAPRIRHVP